MKRVNSSKRLRLHKETLCELSREQLGHVAGGTGTFRASAGWICYFNDHVVGTASVEGFCPNQLTTLQITWTQANGP